MIDRRSRRWRDGALRGSMLVAAAAGIWILSRLAFGLTHGEFVDESSQIVRAQLVLSGLPLYAEVFAHKAPGAIMAAWLAGLLGAESLAEYRLIPATLYGAAILAVAASPVLRRPHARLIAAAIAAALIGAFALIWSGQMLHYKVLAGALVSIALALAVLPAAAGRSPDRVRGAIAGVCTGLIPSMVLTYFIPALVLCGVVALNVWRREGRFKPDRGEASFFIGAGAGVLAWIAWIGLFGSYRAFFDLNVTFNATVYASFMQNGAINPLLMLDRLIREGWSSVDGGLYAAAMLAYFFAVSAFTWRAGPSQDGSKSRVRSVQIAIFVLLMILPFSLDPRGASGIHAAAVYPAAFIAFALAVGRLSIPTRLRSAVGVGAVLTGVALLLIPVWSHRETVEAQMRDRGPAEPWLLSLPASRIITAVTDPGEAIGVYPFIPTLHTATRRPAFSGGLQLLPWQAEWHARRGEIPPACADIAAAPPPLIVFGHQPVWGDHHPREFAACLAERLEAAYAPVNDALTRVYVRKDRLDRAHAAGFRAATGPTAYAARAIHPDVTLRQYVDLPAGEAVLDLLVATYAGTAEAGLSITVLGPDGETRGEAMHEAAALADNTYVLTHLRPGRAGLGTIVIESLGEHDTVPAAVWTAAPSLRWYDANGQVDRHGLCLRVTKVDGTMIESGPACPGN